MDSHSEEKETRRLSNTLAPATLEVQQGSERAKKAIRRASWIQFAALCYAIYACGWNDGTLGPLLPRIQEVYHVNYAVVSLVFITSCVGYISGAWSYIYLTDRFGFGTMVVLGSLVAAVGHSLQASGAPFPVFVIGFLLVGLGLSFLDAGSNAYIAGLTEDTSIKMGVMHAIYGVGAMFAPLVSTQFALVSGRRWSYAYLVHVGLLVMNAVIMSLAFRLKSQNDCYAMVGQAPPEKTKASEEGINKYRQIFRIRAVHLMGFFIFVYVGIEVAIGGWIVTYIINERNGGPNSGYISSGYWGGLTVGRVALLWVNRKLGEWRAILVYIVIVLGLEIVVWRVDDLIASAVCVSFVGFFLGPIFPIVMNHAGRILPPELIAGSIGWIASFGAVGSAAFPFITGAIASGTDIGSLQPLLISLMGLLFVIWIFVPRTREQLK